MMEVLLGLWCCFILPLAFLLSLPVMGWFHSLYSLRRELDRRREERNLQKLDEVEKKLDALDQSSLSPMEELKALEEIMEDMRQIEIEEK